MRLFNLALLGGALVVALAVVCMRGVLMQGLGAVLRAVGMTARQQQSMLALEGLMYTLGAAVLAAGLTLLTAPAVRAVLGSAFWFLSYRFTLWPVLAILPAFAALGVLIPMLSGRAERRHSIVERLRQE